MNTDAAGETSENAVQVPNPLSVGCALHIKGLSASQPQQSEMQRTQPNPY